MKFKERKAEYLRRTEAMSQAHGEPELIDVEVTLDHINFINHGEANGVNPSSLITKAISLAGLCRVSRALGLQVTAQDSRKTVSELAVHKILVPDINALTSRRKFWLSAFGQEALRQASDFGYVSEQQLLFEGIEDIKNLLDLAPPVSIVSQTTRFFRPQISVSLAGHFPVLNEETTKALKTS